MPERANTIIPLRNRKKPTTNQQNTPSTTATMDKLTSIPIGESLRGRYGAIHRLDEDTFTIRSGSEDIRDVLDGLIGK